MKIELNQLHIFKSEGQKQARFNKWEREKERQTLECTASYNLRNGTWNKAACDRLPLACFCPNLVFILEREETRQLE